MSEQLKEIADARANERASERQRARRLLHQAVNYGKIYKSEWCEACGKDLPARDIHGHHHDYSKPLDVRWLCRQCHVTAHNALK